MGDDPNPDDECTNITTADGLRWIWLTNGGPASCTADLFYFSWNAGQPTTVILASTSFAAAG
jgi:hypothetical protein